MLTIFFNEVPKSIFFNFHNLTKQVSTSCIPGNLDGFLSLDDKLLCFRESFVSNNIYNFYITDEI